MSLNAFQHPSGALKREQHGLDGPFLWFPDCQKCKCGDISTSYGWGISDPPMQCRTCLNRYIQWHKEHCIIRYSIFGTNYPRKCKIDESKNLEKSKGRIFYHEINYAVPSASVRVHIYSINPATNEQEVLRIDGKYVQCFSSIEAAQAWVAAQGASLRSFWL
jgi:hypothetical protein